MARWFLEIRLVRLQRLQTMSVLIFFLAVMNSRKKEYDLNFLRLGSNNPVTPYQDYSLVIEYNPKLTSDPPPGFKKIVR